MIEALDGLQAGLGLGNQLVDDLAARIGVAVAVRVELGAEDLENLAGNARVFAQGFFLGRLRRIEAGLLAVFGEGADQSRVAPADAKLQHQTVEAVGFGVFGPDGREGVLERILDVGEAEIAAARVLEQELVDVDGVALDGAHGVTELLKRLEAHVRQDRQDIGERGRVASPVELEAELEVGVLRGAEGANDHVSGAEPVHFAEIDQGLAGVVAVAIAGREGFGPVAGQGADAGVGQTQVAGGLFEAIGPAARGLDDPAFQLRLVRLEMLARRDADDVVDADQGRVCQLGIPGRHAAAPGLRQNLADPLANACVEPLARDEDHDRHEAVERIAAREQTHARAIVQVQDAQGGGQ